MTFAQNIHLFLGRHSLDLNGSNGFGQGEAYISLENWIGIHAVYSSIFPKIVYFPGTQILIFQLFFSNFCKNVQNLAHLARKKPIVDGRKWKLINFATF